MHAPGNRAALAIISCFALALVAIGIGLYVVVGRDNPSHDTDHADSIGHVHGLGINPADGLLYVAAHSGVFRVSAEEVTRVADRWQDTMGFAVIGPDRFLASGHPDLREDLPPHLGLIESVDAAETWQALSLQGEADLHAIEPTDQTLYAYDATTGQLIATDDRRSWRVLDQQPLIDLAATGSSTLYATTDTGQLLQYADGAPAAPMDQAPTLVFIDAEPDGRLLGAGPDGQLYLSTDGVTWTEVGAVAGTPAAVDIASEQWHIATDRGIFRSTDQGRSWEPLLGETS